MDNMESLKKMFKNVDSKRLNEAVLKAQTLSKNPQIRNAFSNADLSNLSNMISNLNENDKQRILRELGNPKNVQLLNAIKNNLRWNGGINQMADLDKDSIINMIGSILGENKSSSQDNISQSDANMSQKNMFSGSFSDNNSSSDLLDTAMLMSKMTDVVGKLNQSKNNREFALLSAVKPYMRDDRKGKIDTCLKILQVVNVINTIK